MSRFRLDVPPSERVLDVLSGPGLNAPLVTAQTAARIRAGVAHPVIAAGIAVWRAGPGLGEHALGGAVTAERHPAASLASSQPDIGPGLRGSLPFPCHCRRLPFYNQGRHTLRD